MGDPSPAKTEQGVPAHPLLGSPKMQLAPRLAPEPRCPLPAYQNLRQRVDNFVANHLATHTWSPHLNKNQLRNNIRQQVLKSGMLESGIDRIISQVVDPKINHTFRPQVEKAVHEFLATLNHKEEASGSASPDDEKADSSGLTQGVPVPGPSANAANDAMSILETITSLNQEASAARASTETPNAKSTERGSKKLPSQPSMDASAERDRTSEDMSDREKPLPDSGAEAQETAPRSEELSDLPCPVEETKNHVRESNNSVPLSKDVQPESSDQKAKLTDKGEKKPDSSEKGERKKEKKEKTEKKFDHSKRNEDTQKGKEEKQAKDKEAECAKPPSERGSSRAKGSEGAKEDCSLLGSDVDGLTDITVSSVHTSDLSSFEEDTEEEVVMSESMEEGEITSDDEEKCKQNKTKTQTSDSSEGKAKGGRHAYVHKPYLYSKYYSDSDDELTVEQRRQSIAKEKEERLIRRQINREKLEEKRKQKAEKMKSSKAKSQGKSSMDLEESSAKGLEPKAPRIKEVLKERKVLEKKVALSKKRKKDSRNVEETSKKKQQSEEDSKEALRANEHCEKEKVSSSKDSKHVHAKSEAGKPARRLSESLHSAEENKNEPRMEREHKRRTSTPVAVEGAQEETDAKDVLKRQAERSDAGTEEPQKQKGALKTEKHLKKDDSETAHSKNLPKREAKCAKERLEKEKLLLEDKPLPMKHKSKGDGTHKTSDEAEPQSSDKALKADECVQKPRQPTMPSADDKPERKSKHRNERKLSVLGKDGKPVSEYIIKTDENVRKENSKKERHLSADRAKAEHKSRRSSDSRLQRDSLSSRQHGVPSQRRSESYSEDRCDADSTNLDGNSKPEEAAHKEKRRTKSLLEEKLSLKSKSKSQGKQLKVAETELQESVPKQAAASKPDREKPTEEGDPDRQRRPKAEDRPSEETSGAGGEPGVESAIAGAHGAHKESGHRAKAPAAKDKYKGDKDSGSSRLERKLADGHKSRTFKHSSKDPKKKEENRSDDKDGKEVDSNHEKARGTGSGADKKLSRRLWENRRGSVSQEVSKGEEKLAAGALATPSTSSLPRPRKSGDSTLATEQEPMEVDAEPAVERVCDAPAPQEGGSAGAQPGVDPENVTKQRSAAAVKDELRASAVDSKSGAPTCKAGRGAGAVSNSDKHTDHRSTLVKKGHVQGAVSRLNPGEKEPAEQGAQEGNVDPDAGARWLPRALSESERAQRSLRATSRPPAEHASPADTAPGHPAQPDPPPSLGAVTAAPQAQSQEPDVAQADEGLASEGGAGSASPRRDSDVPNQALTAFRARDSREGGAVSTADTQTEAGAGGRGHQATSLPSKQRKSNAPLDRDSADRSVESKNLDREGDLVDTAKTERAVSKGPSSKQAVGAAGVSDRKAGSAAGPVAGVRTGEDAAAAQQKRCGGPGGTAGAAVGAERRTENSEVDTSAGGASASSLSPQRAGAAERAAARTPVPTSSEGKGKGVTFGTVKAGAATTTSAEAGAGQLAVPCTSIEADEGVTAASGTAPRGAGAEASGRTVLAAAEEGGGVVTEGLAESETVLTSTKEGESREAALAESGQSAPAAEPAGAAPGADNTGSAATEDKDDAVTSAGSSRRDSEMAGGAVAFVSEVESDGAVTSAGTDIRAGSLSSEEGDGFQTSALRMGPKKEPEGTVTCTGAGGRGGGFAVCAVAGAGPPEERLVSGAACGGADKAAPPGTSAPQEGDGSANDGAEGESAVTSTGITEEDGEGPASCTGSEESGDGFALSSESEENAESAMDSTVATEASDARLVAAGPGDDEGVVTSTGAKEEDDEGEGVVTSTGRGNEVGPAATCTGLEEEGEGAVMSPSAGEGDPPARTAAGRGAEAGGAVTDASESDVDSVSGEGAKGTKAPEIGSSAKGIVESSVTSAAPGAGPATRGPGGCEGPMTSAAAAGQRDSQPAVEGAPLSADLVGGSYEVRVCGAAPAGGIHHTSTSTKEDEGTITSVENEECDGMLATTASDSVAHQAGAAGGRSRGKGEISTSRAGGGAAQAGKRMDVEGGHSSALGAEGAMDGARVRREEFEAPMPSAASRDESQPAAPGNEDKDECAMISTSLGEECEVPISSANSKFPESQPAGATTEERAQGPRLVSTEDFEVPMPSAPAEVGRPLASTSKEEKDECALISTSIAEECEASISGAAEERSVTAAEEKDGSAIISTSSVEDCEGPVSSALPQGTGRPSATAAEELGDAAMISTSTSEGCEAVMLGHGPLDQEQPSAARVEDSSDTALISTSTVECVLITTGLDTHGESQLTANKPEGMIVASAALHKCDIPTPSLITEDSCQQPGPWTGGQAVGPMGTVSTEEGQDSVSVGELPTAGGQPSVGLALEREEQSTVARSKSALCLVSAEEKPVSTHTAHRANADPEAETVGDGPSAGLRSSGSSPPGPRGPEQVPGDEGPCVSAGCETAASPGAKKGVGSPCLGGSERRSSPPPDPRGSQGSLDTTASECGHQKAETAPAHTVAPPAACGVALPAPSRGQDRAVTGDRGCGQPAPACSETTGGGATPPSPKEGGLGTRISSEERVCGTGNEESALNVPGGLEPDPDWKTEMLVSSGKEQSRATPAPPGNPAGRPPRGGADLPRASPSGDDSLDVEISGSRSSAESDSKASNKEEVSDGRKDHTEAVRDRSVEVNRKEVEAEEKYTPRRKRKKPCPSSEDEPDDNADALESKTETAQRQSSGTELQDAKEGNPGDLEELSKSSSKKNSTGCRAMEERDESSSSEATGEKTEPNEDDNVKSQEEDQPVIVKRKRGRPRKYPVEAPPKAKEECRADSGLVAVEQSPPGSRLKGIPADESSKETANQQERGLGNDDGEEKAVASVRRRGRKPKRSLTSSDDAESSEPERKRQKSISEATEDKKDQESEEEEEEEEEEEPLGATTRSSTRSEAQRSKAQLSPPTKRRRDASPPGARTRGQQQRVEEAPAKKAKR
ncbi:PREDICTED: biorientation of chromosomes in cell division protein 1-like 1 [Condylura cristata]|uniref:biorientation of chromosomes in cell division protein 1-like 1 n=1 Tax=Condylura cristata TaxID=143302 RepID=UPI000642C0D0|nr:PREDICTED: biorientation of chromosomes in cell division protein 1-like 1 [Condylura cristata]